MTDRMNQTRAVLVEAFRREGIDYPADRLDEAVEEFSHLKEFVARIQAELYPQAGSDDRDE